MSALFPILGSFEGGAQHNEQGNRTIMLEHSHLVIEFYSLRPQILVIEMDVSRCILVVDTFIFIHFDDK